MLKTSVLVAGTVGLLVLAMPHLAAASSAKSAPDARVDLTAAKKKAKVAVKTCGAFMYRKDGQCVDARAKK